MKPFKVILGNGETGMLIHLENGNGYVLVKEEIKLFTIRSLKKYTTKKAKPIKRCTEKMFNEFWELYPTTKKRRIGKEKCLKKYTSFPIEEHTKIMEGLKQFLKDENWNNEYHPQTSKFLNQKQWEGAEETPKKEVKKDLIKI